jgi:hypothetical protein
MTQNDAAALIGATQPKVAIIVVLAANGSTEVRIAAVTAPLKCVRTWESALQPGQIFHARSRCITILTLAGHEIGGFGRQHTATA